MKYVARFVLAIGSLTGSVASHAQLCPVVESTVAKAIVAGTAAGATVGAVAASAMSGAEKAKDGTIRVLHSSGEAIRKNRNGRYLPGTFGDAVNQTKRVWHSSGRAITKNASGKYLSGTLAAAGSKVIDATRASGRYIGSRAGREAVIATVGTLGRAGAHYGGEAAVTGATELSVPVVVVASTVAVAGTAGAILYCNSVRDK